ncbi:hypothetical protein [Lacibacter sp.]|uniref:hypothetical protein n=1 Tax=Lacibacter sp. TaxID=1915409 RepID=UPI002B4AC680|nr:hypothetical protein [Lacibacter sp.]HLP35964.1 hypothetical protein [Lacibacter sp.]
MNKLVLVLLIVFFSKAIFGQEAASLFDKKNMEYKGSKSEQAKLLLRKVGIFGKKKENQATIDTVFLALLDSPLNFTVSELRRYLLTIKISENLIGGNLDGEISWIYLNGKKVCARYFVIHDVSAPVYKNHFPENINDTTWNYNKPSIWKKKVAHTYLTRTGGVNSVADFSEGIRATKFELKVLGKQSRGLFIHIELIQPRVYPPGTSVSAPIAPDPGFTQIQYRMLALLYICASVRKGEWLVPAYHAIIDEGLDDGHDDPQRFDLLKFTNEIIVLTRELELIKN